MSFWKWIKNFKKDEMSCKCGCGRNVMKEDFIKRLSAARLFADIPFVITSACRCSKHNKAVGGVSHSAHVFGYAVDIKAVYSSEKYLIVTALTRVGFNRIGIGKDFIHVDSDPSLPPNVIWTY